MKSLPLILMIGVASVAHAQPKPVQVLIDTKLSARVPTIVNARWGEAQVRAYRDANGTIGDFVAKQLIIKPKTQTELVDFINRRQARLLTESSAILEEAAVAKAVADNKVDLGRDYYLVEIIAKPVDAAKVVAQAQAIGYSGSLTFGSKEDMALFSVMFDEMLMGFEVVPNFVSYPHFINRSEEGFDSAGARVDAFSLPEFSSDQHATNVSKAWRFVSAALGTGIVNPVKVAIVDSGFWVDPVTRQPRSGSAGTDMPALLGVLGRAMGQAEPQATFCASIAPSLRAQCLFHGNASASIAVGRLNNGIGAAGTGGNVSNALLVQIDAWDNTSIAMAIRATRAFRPDVLNMSFGQDNGFFGNTSYNTTIGSELTYLYGSTFLVASAGNDNAEAGLFLRPCADEHVHLCVGALGGSASRGAWPSSNYGGHVDVWAPSTITVMEDGVTMPALGSAAGTSAAAPYVTGIVAMVRGVAPWLTPWEIKNLIMNTSWVDSTSWGRLVASRVTRRINAYAAVSTAQNQFFRDQFEDNNTAEAARTLYGSSGYLDFQTLHTAADEDYFVVNLYADGVIRLDFAYLMGFGGMAIRVSPVGSTALVTTHVRWSSDDTGATLRTGTLPRGSYLIRIATNGGPVPFASFNAYTMAWSVRPPLYDFSTIDYSAYPIVLPRP